ncbi:AraC family transcriptional regulator [Archangium violaceum]|uniref:helix-turn-helix domain-containing protein n=1 Tax=Archangium violaceum TaxID=83451 RepID=UPI002B2866A2|nr:AraC family transcriptional regulator [Archangium gephyra]
MLAYLTGIRLARARALLLSSDEAVSQIAHRAGYEDPSTFTALFKQHHGQTPSAYRKSSAGAFTATGRMLNGTST